MVFIKDQKKITTHISFCSLLLFEQNRSNITCLCLKNYLNPEWATSVEILSSLILQSLQISQSGNMHLKIHHVTKMYHGLFFFREGSSEIYTSNKLTTCRGQFFSNINNKKKILLRSFFLYLSLLSFSQSFKTHGYWYRHIPTFCMHKTYAVILQLL